MVALVARVEAVELLLLASWKPLILVSLAADFLQASPEVLPPLRYTSFQVQVVLPGTTLEP